MEKIKVIKTTARTKHSGTVVVYLPLDAISSLTYDNMRNEYEVSFKQDYTVNSYYKDIMSIETAKVKAKFIDVINKEE